MVNFPLSYRPTGRSVRRHVSDLRLLSRDAIARVAGKKPLRSAVWLCTLADVRKTYGKLMIYERVDGTGKDAQAVWLVFAPGTAVDEERCLTVEMITASASDPAALASVILPINIEYRVLQSLYAYTKSWDLPLYVQEFKHPVIAVTRSGFCERRDLELPTANGMVFGQIGNGEAVLASWAAADRLASYRQAQRADWLAVQQLRPGAVQQA